MIASLSGIAEASLKLLPPDRIRILLEKAYHQSLSGVAPSIAIAARSLYH
jgi:hypothetical protein